MTRAEDLEQQVANLQNEKKLFFDTIYRSYTRLAEAADACPHEETRRRINDAITDLGSIIGRTEARESPR